MPEALFHSIFKVCGAPQSPLQPCFTLPEKLWAGKAAVRLARVRCTTQKLHLELERADLFPILSTMLI